MVFSGTLGCRARQMCGFLLLLRVLVEGVGFRAGGGHLGLQI